MILSIGQLVILTLTLPLWTIFTFHLLLLLIIYLRCIKYFNYYDKCNRLNAHFAYDIELVVGRESNNFCINDSLLIFDLLDNHAVSVITIQVASSSVFLESEVLSSFSCASNENLRKICFTIYRKQPFKEIKSIRAAHTCNAEDSRLYIYGLRIHDRTNKDVKFFPITSIVRNRSTQWALNTTFEADSGSSFAKMGAELHDPYEHSTWPTYIEILNLLFVTWSFVFYMAYLMPISLLGQWLVHSLVVYVIGALGIIVISLIYLLAIKANTYNQNNVNGKLPGYISNGFKLLIICLSLTFGVLTLKSEQFVSENEAFEWIASSILANSSLTITIIIIYISARIINIRQCNKLLRIRDNELARTNSKPDLFTGFVNVNRARAILALKAKQDQHLQQKQASSQQITTTITGRMTKSSSKQQSGSKQQQYPIKSPRRKHSHHNQQQQQQQGNSSSKGKSTTATTSAAMKVQKNAANFNEPIESKDNLDNDKPSADNLYIKTKNRNSISQYV